MMLTKTAKVFVFTASIVTLISLTLQAGRVGKDVTPMSRAVTYSMQGTRTPLGTSSYTSGTVSPGVTVGYTWLDEQHQCSMGRMVGIGPHSGGSEYSFVHFSWSYLPGPDFDSLRYRYSAYRSTDASFVDPTSVVGFNRYGGYVNIDVTADNRAVVGGHTESATGPQQRTQPQVHYDICPACGDFTRYDRVPDSLVGWEQMDGDEAMWPKFLFQIGEDTVLHVLAPVNDYNKVQALMYFRKLGYEASPGGWVYPPYVVDSVPIRSHVLDGDPVGSRVAMAWFANLPYQEPECDTCSGVSPYYWGYMDNDAYLQTSNDQGATWEPKVNLTQAQIGEAAYKALFDCSILFDQSDNFHVLFHAVPWPADPCVAGGGLCMEDELWQAKSRLMHWSENVPYVRTVCDHTYQPSDSCGVPAWGSTINKMSLGECDGRLYAIWTQYNDIPHGIDNDCAEWVYAGGMFWGGINGDIWVSISQDGGMTWDAQRNLTNSYTPHCDPFVDYDCQNDNWATINRWGKQVQSGENWSGAEIVDPSGGSSLTDWHLDVFYVNDLDAGTAVWGDEGSWTNDPMKWFRLKCVEPILCGVFVPGWRSYGDPNYNRPGEQKDVDLLFENLGNAPVNYMISIIEDNGPAGWLGVTGFSGTVPAGLSNVDTGQVLLNVGGLIVSSGTYYGRLHIEGDDPHNLPCDIEIELIVADTLCLPIHDSVTTDCLVLSVSNYGNVGREGVGKLNMDYYPEDCDSTAKVYLFDGSLLVGRLIGGNPSYTQAMWGAGWLDDNGFRPQCGHDTTALCGSPDPIQVYESGTFTTQDSTLAFEKIYVAPQDDCEFIIEYTRFWSYDGDVHSGNVLGEAIDWDIPGDDLYAGEVLVHPDANSGHFDPTRNLVYLRGYESYTDTGYPYNCQYNDERFGGVAFVESYLNGDARATIPWGGFAAENDSLQASVGFRDDILYDAMLAPGFSSTLEIEDLHTVLTFETDLEVGSADIYEAVTILATIQQGTLDDLRNAIDAGKDWYHGRGGIELFADTDDDGRIDICGCNYSCCYIMGDLNSDEEFNPLDAAYFVNWLWLGGPAPECLAEADADGSCDVNPLDALAVVEYLWLGGEPLSYSCNLECWNNQCGCCLNVGDFNHNGIINMTDAEDFTDYIVNQGPPPACRAEADCDGNGDINWLDVVYLIDYLEHGGPPPVPCPDE